jgi:hypothetical protein
MTVTRPQTAPVRWPSREEFIEWGLRPCKTPDCRILVNVQVTGVPHCAACLRRHHAKRGRR